MDYANLYLVVALSGAIVSTIVTFHPVRKALKMPVYSYAVWLLLAIILFPLFIGYILSESANNEIIIETIEKANKRD